MNKDMSTYKRTDDIEKHINNISDIINNANRNDPDFFKELKGIFSNRRPPEIPQFEGTRAELEGLSIFK